MKHSWPRRSGKTSAAIMCAAERGWKLYSCGFTAPAVKAMRLPFLVTELKGVKNVVIDNYELATSKEIEIIATMDNSEIYGTFGCDAEDYRMVGADQWRLIQRDIEKGFMSLSLALREFNICTDAIQVRSE